MADTLDAKSAHGDDSHEETREDERERVVKSDDEWRSELTPTEFEVTRRGGTEPAFTGEYWDTKTAGHYLCRCCGAELFDSNTKYDSGSGWPSFYQPVARDAVVAQEDRSLGMLRTEILCSACDAHLGHAFPDGPAPTGVRFCMNSASLKLEPSEE